MIKKILFLLLIFFAIFSKADSQCSQCTLLPNAIPGMTLVHQNPNCFNNSGVAYNPNLALYYAVRAGNPVFPLETWTSTGVPLYNTTAGFDWRGMWWNPTTNQLEGNGFSTFGMWSADLNISGWALNTGVNIFNGMNQPDVQSCGDLDWQAYEVLYYFNGAIYRYSRSTNAFLGSYPITGTPVALSNLNSTTLMYTGCSGKEIALLDYVNKSVYVYDKATGAYAGMSQLPPAAITTTSFRTSWANGFVWLFNLADVTWYSYQIFNNQSTTMTASVSSLANVSCNGGSDGSSSVTVSGGTPDYSYSWNTIPVQTTDTASALSAGTYSVTITDANGCSITTTATVTEPTILTAAISSQTNVNCNGGNNGSASVTVSGGATTSYSYSWSTIPIQTTDTVIGLSAGTYTVTVTDGNGCIQSDTITISQPDLITVSAFSTPSGCNPPSGSATVSTTGGTFPFTYLWNDGQTASTATGLAAGSYSVTVTDVNGCTNIISDSVSALGAPIISVPFLKNSTCNGSNDGSVTISATGSSPFTYTWTPSGGTSSIATGLSPGTYSVQVTDNFGCTQTLSVSISEPPPLVLDFKRDYYICAEGSGMVQLTASGGTTYSWSPSTGLDNANIANPVATVFVNTTYTVTVSNGPCLDTAQVSISLVPPPVPPTISRTGDSLYVSQLFSAYQWYYEGSPISGATDFYYNAPLSGHYSVYVTDTVGCRVLSPSLNVVISYVALLPGSGDHGIKVYPNPASESFIIVLPPGRRGEGLLTIYDMIGQEVYRRATGRENQITIDASPFARGVYHIQFSTPDKVDRAKVVKE